ncbi:MAG: hypothetical protein IFK94_15740 [Acidobacteria bacterium]|uniref:Uncharacterized protein n=1 Tax=Candidatus Polarisedimenticola svalbardensis TaxID=2886004 RepID=A0A8J6Y392_9BACT|nr:hypothetical protein [Candidatus Polarisedimenticola svalbardensis]
MNSSGLTLFHLDPALRGMLVSVPIMTVIGLAIRFSAGENLRELSTSDWPGIAVFLIVVLFVMFLFHAVSTGFWTRCNRLTAVLPIPARTLWIVRSLAVAAATILPIAAMTLAMGIGNHPSVFVMGGKILAVLMLLVAIGQSPFPKLHRVQVCPTYIVFLVFLSFFAMIYLLVTPTGLMTILIPAGLALLITMQTFTALPRGFSLAPATPGRSDGAGFWNWIVPPDPGEGTAVVAAAPGYVEPERTFRQVLRLTLFRTLVNKFHIWIIGLVLVFVSGATLYEFASGQGHWLPVLYSPLWLMAHLQQSPRWIGTLAPLPIRSNLVFRYVTGSLLLPILAGALLGLLIIVTSQPVLVNLEQGEPLELEVPYEFWIIAEEGTTLTAIAPWGERLTLPAHTIAPRSGRTAVNPFAIGDGSSERFIAWQQARAIQAVYDLEQIPDPENPQVPAGARSPLHHRTWGLGLVLVSSLLIAGMIACLQQPRTKTGRFLLKALLPALGVSIGLVILAMLVGPVYGWTSREALDAVPVLMLGRLAASLGFSGSTYLVAAGLVMIGGWFLVGRAFAKVEPDGSPTETPWQAYRN